MFTRTRPTGGLVALLIGVLMFTLIVAACGGDDDDDDDNGNGDGAQATATEGSDDNDDADEPAGGGGGDPTGTFTLGDETWTFAASIQCGVFPGPTVAISGNAVDDASVEFVIDFDEQSNLVAASVNRDDETWRAEDENVSIEVDGRTVTGQGSFREFISGEMADGSFEITC